MVLKRQKQHSGFTLVELLLVVAIVGLLLSVSINVYSNTRKRQNLIGATVTLENILKDARNASLIGLKGFPDTEGDVPSAYGVYLQMNPDGDATTDDSRVVYFLDDDNDNIFDDESLPADEQDTIVEIIEHTDNVAITQLNDGTFTEASILFKPPRGLALIGRDDGGFVLLEQLDIIMGVEGETDENSSLTGLLEVTTGGGRIDLKLY